MAEKTLALPLSGTEVVEAISEQIKRVLSRDCYLAATSAYDWFEAEVEVKVRMHDLGRMPGVETKVVVTGGVAGPEGEFGEVVVGFRIGKAAPNEVRLENGLAVPVLGTTKEGRPEIRRVRYKIPAMKTE